MSMALKSTFEHIFTSFIVCFLKEMNEWKNIDILFNSQCNKESDSLFVIKKAICIIFNTVYFIMPFIKPS